MQGNGVVNIKKTLLHGLLAVTGLILLSGAVACNNSLTITDPEEQIEKARIKIHDRSSEYDYSEGEEPPFTLDRNFLDEFSASYGHASGVIIDEWGYALSVFNFESHSYEALEVELATGERYPATIQAVDARTSAVLLKIDADRLPAAPTGNSAALTQGQRIYGYFRSGPCNPSLSGVIQGTSNLSYNNPALRFNFNPDREMFGEIRCSGPTGDVVTDGNAVVGMFGAFYGGLILPTIMDGDILNIVSMDSALEMLSPDANQKPWSEGPVWLECFRKGIGGGPIIMPPNRSEINSILDDMTSNLGEPLSSEIIPCKDLRGIMEDYSVFAAIYPREINLRDGQGKTVAKARWIGIGWNGDGENRLYYGRDSYRIEGGFILPYDISILEKALYP